MSDPAVRILDTGPTDIRADELLRAVYLRSDHPAFIVGFRNRKILACTPQVERVFGYSPSELVGGTTECLHEDREQYLEFGDLSEPMLETDTLSFHARFRMRRKDGSTFPSENFVTLIRDEQRRPVAALSIVHDLSRIAESADEVPESAMHLAALAANIPGGLFQRVRAPDGRIHFTFLRGAVARELGIDPIEAQRNPEVLFDRIHPEDRSIYHQRMEHSFETLQPMDVLLRFQGLNDRIRYIRTISQPRRLDDGSVAWDGMVFDVTAEKRAEENLRYAIYHDALTGLPNLAAFRDRLRAALDRIDGHGHALVAVINLRRFRFVNETLGLEAGDRIISAAAARLQSVLHHQDFLARFHNDEFLALIEIAHPDAELNASLNGLRTAFDLPLQLPELGAIKLESNIGLSIAPSDGEEPDDLLRNAETALHHARRDSANHIQFYQRSMTSELLENIELERSLKSAIADDVLEPFLQPQVDIDTGEVVGMEALARWHHDGQWISPARFIPVAEENGLIVELGRQQLSKLITNLQQWQAEGYRTVPVSVNFSALQFADPTFSDWLIATLDQSGLSRQAICVEITESVFLHDFKAANQVINDLHEAGIVFSLDDFGTGFSSLAYLSRLPFSILKIDQSFVQHILDDRRSANLVRSIIDMAGALDLSVIAEGVETEAQINELRRMGCRTVQGFLTGRPVPLDQAASLLRGQSSTTG